MNSIEALTFDSDNKQVDYQYMARGLESNKFEIGYVAVEKPWYTGKNEWSYWIIKNEYGGGFCGGANNLGFEKVLVDEKTIESFTQIAKIKYNQYIGIDTHLECEGKIIVIKADDKIPYELWNNCSQKQST